MSVRTQDCRNKVPESTPPFLTFHLPLFIPLPDPLIIAQAYRGAPSSLSESDDKRIFN